MGAYALYLDHQVGDAWAFVHVQGVFWHRHVHSGGPFSGLWLAVRDGYRGASELVQHLPRAPGAPKQHDQWASWNVIQLLLLVAAAWLTWVAYRRLGLAYALYSAATLLIVLSSPADIVPLVSLPRYLLGDFPLFIALASDSAAVTKYGADRLRSRRRCGHGRLRASRLDRISGPPGLSEPDLQGLSLPRDCPS